jgi:hypothetical protein
MKIAGEIKFEGEGGFAPQEMYVDGDTLVVIGSSGRERGASPAIGGKAAPALATQTTVPAAPAAATTAAAPAAATQPAAVTQPAVEAQPAAASTPAFEIAEQQKAADSEPAIDVIRPYPEQRSATAKALVYDISDRGAARLARVAEIEGYYKTSRKIGDSLYIVANKSFYEYGWYPAAGGEGGSGAAVPPIEYRDSAAAGGEFAPLGYGSMYYFPGRVARNYMAVVGIDVKDASAPASAKAVLASGDNVYASSEFLYLAAAEYAPMAGFSYSGRFGGFAAGSAGAFGGAATTVHRFRLDGGNVEYDGMGEVGGIILNQFSMDQNGKYFRIATTSSGYDEASGGYASTKSLYVLGEDLGVVGRLDGLAPGEQIYSVRFMGDRAYVVTFKTVDPLFVIDLSDPAKPAVLGSLKIPGYSDYLHPYGENHVIGFGKDTVEYANDWDGGQSVSAYYQGMKIALFDVSDVANPKELFKESIGDRGTDSPLLRDHRALLFSLERGLLAFPVTVMAVPESEKTGDYKEDSLQYGQFEFQGAYVYSLSLESGFALKGRITHISEDEYRKAGSYWYDGGGSEIERLLYIRDSLYALSQSAVTANDIATMEEKGRLSLR